MDVFYCYRQEAHQLMRLVKRRIPKIRHKASRRRQHFWLYFQLRYMPTESSWWHNIRCICRLGQHVCPCKIWRSTSNRCRDLRLPHFVTDGRRRTTPTEVLPENIIRRYVGIGSGMGYRLMELGWGGEWGNELGIWWGRVCKVYRLSDCLYLLI